MAYNSKYSEKTGMLQGLTEGLTQVTLELVGLDGNAFAVLGAFQQAARRQGWGSTDIKLVRDKATSGDYDHLLGTILAHTESEAEAFEEENDWEDFDQGDYDEDRDELGAVAL